MTRDLAAAQQITFPENVYLHSDTLSGGVNKNKIFYHSRDVGVFPPQTIPKALSWNGFKLADKEFAEPLIPQQVVPLQQPFNINALQMIQDLAETSLDPNFLMSLICGSPQGYNGPFKTCIHKNYKMDKATRKKLAKQVQEQQQKQEVTKFYSQNQIQELFPAAFFVPPRGAVPHNRQAKIDILMGRDARMRPIIDDSKMTSEGWSVNSGMSYEWMHMVQFTTIHHCLKGIVMLEKRLLQLGFKSRYFRIWVAKHDVEGAYRIRFISKEDRWLSVFHQEANGFVSITIIRI